jgi:hypothetical protein
MALSFLECIKHLCLYWCSIPVSVLYRLCISWGTSCLPFWGATVNMNAYLSTCAVLSWVLVPVYCWSLLFVLVSKLFPYPPAGNICSRLLGTKSLGLPFGESSEIFWGKLRCALYINTSEERALLADPSSAPLYNDLFFLWGKNRVLFPLFIVGSLIKSLQGFGE